MKELLLQTLATALKTPTNAFPPVFENRFYSPKHDIITGGIYNNYPDVAVEYDIISSLYSGKKAVVAEIFSGRGKKIQKIISNIDSEKSQADLSKVSFMGVDRLLKNMDISWADEDDRVSWLSADVLSLEKNQADFVYTCMDNPTITCFPTYQMARMFRSLYNFIRPGGYLLCPFSVVNPYQNVHVSDVVKCKNPVILNGLYHAYFVRGSVVRDYDYEELHDLVVLGDMKSTAMGEEFVPRLVYYFYGEGNFIYGRTTIDYLAAEAGFTKPDADFNMNENQVAFYQK